MPTDEVEIDDGRVDTGRHYVEATNAFALEGNGWYCDAAVAKALEYKLSTSEDIKYQLKATMSLKPNHFNKVVLEVHAKFESPEQAINWFIGLLGKAKNKTSTVC